MRIGRFTLFCHLWAIAGFCEWTRWTWSESGYSGILFVASLTLAIFPNSRLALGLLAVGQAAFTLFAANSPWNHGLFMALMNAAILGALASSEWKRVRTGVVLTNDEVLDQFAPVLRVSLIIVYLFTWFHKLNLDFLNPDYSAAGVVLGWINRTYRILPTEGWAIVVSICATIVVELLVPVLLCVRRTVYIGLAIGFGFHLFLSQYGGLHGFAAMLYAVYFLFLPRAFAVEIGQRFEHVFRFFATPKSRMWALVFLSFALVVVGKLARSRLGFSHIYFGLVVWDVWLVAVLWVLARDLLRLPRMVPDFTLRPPSIGLAVIPLIVFLNGLSPYLGLKTETSWAMYSNLRTEIRGNHLIVPSWTKVFSWQDDLVEIDATSVPALQSYIGAEMALTFFEFRRLCSTLKGNLTIDYRRNGVAGRLEIVDDVANDPELVRPHPWLLGKLLRFRPVDTGAHALCRH